jgi:hypothetical protein
MRRAIRQPSPFIPSVVELEKFWEDVDSSSYSPLGTESKKRGRELDNDSDDSSQGLPSGGATPEKRQRIEE